MVNLEGRHVRKQTGQSYWYFHRCKRQAHDIRSISIKKKLFDEYYISKVLINNVVYQ
jgi:hypothetical protein